MDYSKQKAQYKVEPKYPRNLSFLQKGAV